MRALLRRPSLLMRLPLAFGLALLWLAAAQPRTQPPQPDLVVDYFSGLVGYVEPCRCSGNVLGGVARRLTYLSSLKQTAPRRLLLFAGDIVGGGGLEHEAKGRAAVQFFNIARYDALLAGDADIRYGVSALNTNAARALPFVCANKDAQPQWAQGHRIFSFALPGRKRPLIVGVSGVSGWGRGTDGIRELSEQELVACAQQAVRKLRERCDFVILMVHADLPVCMKVADAVPGIDLLIAGHVGSTTTQQPILRGKTIIVANGDRGRFAAKLELWFTRDLKLEKLQNVVTELSSGFKDHPAVIPAILEYKKRVAAWVESAGPPRTPSPYVGWRECAKCHKPETEQWLKTRHARAFETLAKGAQGLNASLPECLECHTVGSGTPGGYLNRKHTGHLGGVQCESCHGEGRQHAEAASQKKPSAHLIKASVPEKVCLRCHTSDRCPNFKYQQAVRLVVHKAVSGTGKP